MDEFSIHEIIILIKKRFLLISICTLTGVSIFFLINKFLINETYQASVQMYVNPKFSVDSAELNELTYAQKVVTTYISFLQTKSFYKQIIKECNLQYTENELKEMTNIQTINNTEIFQIDVTSFSPAEAYQIVKAMEKVAPLLIVSIDDTAKVRVVDPAEFPSIPTSPNIVRNTFVGGFIGFILALLFSVLWEMLDVKLKSEDDLMKKYSLPILGVIPNFRFIKKKNNIRYKIMSRIRKEKNNERLENYDVNTRFMVEEAYKSFRTNLRFTLSGDKCKKIMISSPFPEDGKSTTSVNIAIAIAQTGAGVLLIDCDLRKGRVHNYFNLKSTPGVSDILSGMLGLEEVIQNTGFDNLQVMTIGSIAPNPTELLSSNSMEELMKRLEKYYEYIIIDTPPVEVVSDSLSLVKVVDGVVLVVREGVSTYPNITRAINKYKFVEAKILGFVINGVIFSQGSLYKSKYYYHYGDKND